MNERHPRLLIEMAHNYARNYKIAWSDIERRRTDLEAEDFFLHACSSGHERNECLKLYELLKERRK